ncbi:Uncharacterised protein [Mycobacterium tuberculosis]|uniref:Uncharacterized protein n=1 Tax=Mycobacterium tuberculosis TaxID=1773 RepID=A0A916LBU7_MYCTX|nr:Uncharacterised protein [Mycobacterium tuberculosis]
MCAPTVGQQCVALAQIHQPNTLGLPSRLANLACRGADHATAGSDGIQLAVVVDNQRPNQPAAPAVVHDRQHTFTAAALYRVFLDRGTFRIAP